MDTKVKIHWRGEEGFEESLRRVKAGDLIYVEVRTVDERDDCESFEVRSGPWMRNDAIVGWEEREESIKVGDKVWFYEGDDEYKVEIIVGERAAISCKGVLQIETVLVSEMKLVSR